LFSLCSYECFGICIHVMASNEGVQSGMVPSVSARGKHNKETFRDMILAAVNFYEQYEKRLSSFKMISDYIDRCFHVRNDFIIRHMLKQLVCMCILCQKNGTYGIRELKWSPQDQKKKASKRSKRKKSSKKQNKRRKPAKKARKRRQQRSSRKRQKKKKPIC